MAKLPKPKVWDFEGYATRYGVRCGDGEVIAHGAFQNMDGEQVSLVDDHARGYATYLDAILGNAWLEHRDDGVYAYITFNPKYKKAVLRRDQVEHGDIQRLSIKANELRRAGGKIVGGIIRDLSIVSSGANPLASIEPVVIMHGDYADYSEDEFIIRFLDDVTAPDEENAPTGIEHGDNEDDSTVGEIFKGMTEDQKAVAMFFYTAGVESAAGKPGIEHSDEPAGEDETEEITDEEIAEIDAALAELGEPEDDDGEDDGEDDEDDEDPEDDPEDDPEEINHSIDGGKKQMGENFKATGFKNTEGSTEYVGVAVADFMDTIRHGATLSQACIEHGVTSITDLYDQPTAVNPEPLIVNTPQGWVRSVLGGVKKVPFTKIKSLWTDLSAFEGQHRALGYPVLGEQKIDEQIEILNRITEPGWMYKRQKLDRDVLYQISSFNFLQWLQAEMGMMLNQEAARAILIGDGRTVNDPYKIKTDKIRPIAFETGVWTIQSNVESSLTADQRLDEMIDMRADYQGTSTPTMFVAPSEISAWLKTKDGLGNRIYKSVKEIAELLQVAEIVGVPQLGTAVNAAGKAIKSITVNLQDYALSMPTGDAALKDTRFDIDLNKEIYLLEWLVGGALIVPKSALILTQDIPQA